MIRALTIKVNAHQNNRGKVMSLILEYFVFFIIGFVISLFTKYEFFNWQFWAITVSIIAGIFIRDYALTMAV